VNGAPVANSQPLVLDRAGRPLPQLARGRYVVGAGDAWLVSSYSCSSFDSRYFGAVEMVRVRSAVRRLWTAGPDDEYTRGPSPPSDAPHCSTLRSAVN